MADTKAVAKTATPVRSTRGADGIFRDVDGNIDWTHQEVDIEREGTRITLPSEPGPMPIRSAISALERLAKDEETLLDVREDIECFPLEGAVAFNEAMRRIYGWASPTPKMGFFGPSNPDMISVQIDVDQWVQVPWGDFKIPNIENNVGLAAGRADVLHRGIGTLEIAKRQSRSFRRQRLGISRADTLSRAGDDGDLSAEASHVSLPLMINRDRGICC